MRMYEACELVSPDVTFLLDVPVEEALSRVTVKQSYEKMGPSFMEKVRSNYLDVANNLAPNLILVEAAGESIMAVQTYLRVVLMRDYGL